MGIYTIRNDGFTLCRETPTAVNEGEIVVASNEELHADRLSGKRCLGRTVACAEKVMLATTNAYAAPNKTMPELQQMMKSGMGIDPLKDFAEAARDDLGRFSSL
jgi:hypothetical protein